MDPLEKEKDRQRALLNTLTYEIMNPVCLVAQEKIERKQKRKDADKMTLKQSAAGGSLYQTMTAMNYQNDDHSNPLDRHLSDLGISNLNGADNSINAM